MMAVAMDTTFPALLIQTLLHVEFGLLFAAKGGTGNVKFRAKE